MSKMKINIDEVIELDLADLQITEPKLNKILCDQPGRFCYVSTLMAEAKAKREDAERTLEIVRAEEDGEIRRNLGDGKKPPEEAIKKMIEISDGVKLVVSSINKYRTAELMLTAIVQAYSQRKDCAIALAANLRQQFGNTDVSE